MASSPSAPSLHETSTLSDFVLLSQLITHLRNQTLTQDMIASAPLVLVQRLACVAAALCEENPCNYGPLEWAVEILVEESIPLVMVADAAAGAGKLNHLKYILHRIKNNEELETCAISAITDAATGYKYDIINHLLDLEPKIIYEDAMLESIADVLCVRIESLPTLERLAKRGVTPSAAGIQNAINNDTYLSIINVLLDIAEAPIDGVRAALQGFFINWNLTGCQDTTLLAYLLPKLGMEKLDQENMRLLKKYFLACINDNSPEFFDGACPVLQALLESYFGPIKEDV